MLLRGQDGSELELRVVGYEHPETRVDPWDSNSLLVLVRVVSDRGAWEVVDPCLTTWEAERLAWWLAVAAVAAGSAGAGVTPLTEPNLAARATPAHGRPGRLLLRVRLELERRPPWAGGAAGANRLEVEVEVGASQLLAAAADLRADLARFPRRGDDPTL